ncbi:MAG TPA: hypothetical protein VIH42_08605 [Thermoguttaceae bacterium]
MAPLSDPLIIAKIYQALSEWNCTGYITWKAIARAWVQANLEGMTTRAVGEEMFRFVDAGGQIDQVIESRPEWSEHRFHYDFRIPIAGRIPYIETILVEDDPEDPTIHVVSIHDV